MPSLRAALVVFLALGGSALVSGGLSACTSLSLARNENVVQRSSYNRPIWADDDFRGDREGEDVSVVYKKTDVHNLELGIKQANATAVSESQRLLLHRVKVELWKMASDNDVSQSSELDKDLQAAIDSISASKGSFVTSEARPRDVYWEEIREETKEGPRSHYDVYVRLMMPRAELDDGMALVAKSLAASSHSDAKKLAGVVQKKLQAGEG